MEDTKGEARGTDVGRESGTGVPEHRPDVDALRRVRELPATDPAAPCPDGVPDLHPLVIQMARRIRTPGLGALSTVVVVCRRALDGECSSSCALGNYSRSIRGALSNLRESRGT